MITHEEAMQNIKKVGLHCEDYYSADLYNLIYFERVVKYIDQQEKREGKLKKLLQQYQAMLTRIEKLYEAAVYSGDDLTSSVNAIVEDHINAIKQLEKK